MAIKLKNTDLKIVKGNTRIKSVMLGDKTIYGVAIQGPYVFSIQNNEATLTGLTEYGKLLPVINIPKSYNGFPVVKIGQYAFDNSYNLKSITIPASVTMIGFGDFFGTDITVDEGNTVYASHQGILMDKAKTTIRTTPRNIKGDIVLPNTFTRIGYGAFRNCSGLTSVTIPNSVTIIGDGAFSGCKGLTSITIPNSVTSIADEAFYDCTGLTSITVPNSVTSIGRYAFSNCSGLTSITIPVSVAGVGIGAFDGTPLFDNQPDGLVYVDKVAYKYKGTMPLNTAIALHNGTTVIADSAFKNCVGLTSITMPASVTSIGYYAFEGCDRLASITIPENLKNIDNSAFNCCYGLTSVYWNATNCTRAASFDTPTFSGCGRLQTIILGTNVQSIPDAAFKDCNKITSFIIPDSVTSIGDYAFQNCPDLTSIIIPISVTKMGFRAFARCDCTINCEVRNPSCDWKPYWSQDYFGHLVFGYNNIKTDSNYDYVLHGDEAYLTNYKGTETVVTIPNTIGGYKVVSFSTAFKENETVTSIIIPNTSTDIGSSAFYDCTGLTSITVPNSVTSIDNEAFSGCTGLTSITIPNSVTYIGDLAFHYCTKLTTINCEAASIPNGWDRSWKGDCTATVVWGYKGV